MTVRMNRPAPFFVGDHLAVDFLNTVASPAGEPIEWLADGADLLQWLQQAGAIDRAGAARLQRLPARKLDAAADEARALREWFRTFVRRHAGEPLGADALDELQRVNRLLAQDDLYQQIETAPGGAEETAVVSPLRLKLERRWTAADRLLQPIAAAIADLVCHGDFRYVRECEGPACTLQFYDRSKTHRRRWCSMAVCGNREKAAAHRARIREVKSMPKKRRGSGSRRS